MSGPAGGSGIALALAVLEEVARGGPTLSANRIAQLLGIPRTSAYRLINSLTSDEYLLRHPTLDGFVLGVRVVELAHLIAPRTADPTPEIIAGLRVRTGEAVHFVRYSGGRVAIVDEDPDLPLLSIDRTRRQLGATAIGRLLIAEFPPLEPTADPRAAQVVADSARASGISIDERRRIASEVARLGYARCTEPGAVARACVAVPVRSPERELVAAVVLSTVGAEPERAERHLPALIEAGAELAHQSYAVNSPAG
ncbi:IclR family transcriptional regulator [Agromyces allii]|uniref:DNA-binding transcriptional repressor XynR n=1 Tax=Agromyces allii TaxID=393607 RepID=A0ABN2QQM7_9MICO|nr:helix-turn-helix domain-containing protein [Agromyces allii]